MKRTRTPRNRGLRLERMHVLLLLGLSSSSLSAQVLPPPPPARFHQAPAENRLFVRGYHFESNSAFSGVELARVTEPFTNREISAEELEEARRAVSLHYISHGYVNSGALIPDQDPTNGIITIRIVEGVLSGIELHGNKWLRDGYVNSRLQRWATPPLNLNRLREGLQLFRLNPNVRQINAELKPGTAPGEGLLDVRVVDQQPFRVGLEIDNHRPPSVGAEEISLLVSDLNLTGHSDPLTVRYGIADSGEGGFGFSGFDNLEAGYVLPLNRYDTTIGVHGSRLDTSIVEEPFAELDIASETVGYGFFLRQPFFQTANREAAFSVAFEHRQNDTKLLGVPFNLSPGAVNGRTVASVLRLSQELIRRSQDQVLALRSTFNIGLDVLDATERGTGPDGQFFSWLGQAQYVRRLFNTQNQLILRLTGQWTDEPLLALEQISVGGAETVRGYRENELVRDRGFVASLEFRVPVLFNKTGAGIVYLAPFFDSGGAWNVRNSPSPSTIYSTGAGLLISPNKHINAQLYWGYRLRHIESPEDKNAQDLGLHFKVNLELF